MAKIFAVTIVVIAIASAIPIVMHMWPMPQDISTHGHLIDEQYSDTMVEAGVSFLASQILLAFFIWKFSSPKPGDKIKSFPGGAAGLVIAAFLLVGTECLALGVFGVKAWASVYFTPPAAKRCPSRCRRDSSHFISAIPARMESSAQFTPTRSARPTRISSASILRTIRIPRTTS